MSGFRRDTYQDEIQELVEALIENELLSEDVRDEVESLVEEERYEEAIRVATDTRNRQDGITQ